MGRSGRFAERFPTAVKNGIRAQVRRTQAQRKPWARRWLAYMESLSMGARIGRGRNYAISGQIFDLQIGSGFVEAKVQGAEPRPYFCRLECDVVKGRDRKKIVDKLLEQPMLLAQLLVHNLPASAETLFRAAGYPIIPSREYPLRPRCSCPDRVSHCKHVAALLFIMGEAIEQDPMLLLKLRGIGEEELFGDPEVGHPASEGPVASADAAKGGRPFWTAQPLPKDFDYGPGRDKDAAAAPLARRLGPIPFWRGDERFLETLIQCGERSEEFGLQAWAGEPPPRNYDVSGGTPISPGWTLGIGSVW
jgi:uncharacterized Zn finger protein